MKEMNEKALQSSLRMIEKYAQGKRESAALSAQTDPKKQKVNELLFDEQFCDRLFASVDVHEAQAVFQSEGIELTVGEVNLIGQHIVQIRRTLLANGGELSDHELEMVAGGTSSEGIPDAFGTVLGLSVSAAELFGAAAAVCVLFRQDSSGARKTAGEWLTDRF